MLAKKRRIRGAVQTKLSIKTVQRALGLPLYRVINDALECCLAHHQLEVFVAPYAPRAIGGVLGGIVMDGICWAQSAHRLSLQTETPSLQTERF